MRRRNWLSSESIIVDGVCGAWPHTAGTASLGTQLSGYSNCASRVRRYTIFTTNSGIPIDEIVYSAVQGRAFSAANVPATHVYLSYARIATKCPASRQV